VNFIDLEVDWSSLHKLLGDATRPSILELLSQKDGLTYTEILTILRITNTGRLNYHLKTLGDLVAKDGEGKYHLTDQGQLAVKLLKTFAERVTSSEKNRLSALKIIVSIVLILVSILLVASFVLAVLSVPTSVSTSSSESGSLGSSLILPQNLTVSLMQWQSTGGDLQIAWSASDPIYIYVFNQTQYDALLLQYHSSSTLPYLENFTGLPTSWIQQYHVMSDNTTLRLPQGEYYFYAQSPNGAVINSFNLSQSQSPQQQPTSAFYLSPFLYLLLAILVGFGALFLVLAFSILTRRVWR